MKPKVRVRMVDPSKVIVSRPRHDAKVVVKDLERELGVLSVVKRRELMKILMQK